MKVVICGAGLVGSAIASHLASEQIDVTVIDAIVKKSSVWSIMPMCVVWSVLPLIQIF